MSKPINRREFLVNGAWAVGGLVAGGTLLLRGRGTDAATTAHVFPVTHTDAEWRKLLTPAQYHILRESGTEPPGSGEYDQFWKRGTYVCAADGNPLYSSATKYDPHEGWPSFWKPISDTAVVKQPDHSLGMDRDEILCARCGGHLGHVFTDGPPPTGLRYCMDSAALKFIPAKK